VYTAPVPRGKKDNPARTGKSSGVRKRQPRRRQPDNRRPALLDAAARLFSERGFAATSIRDIAASVGMLPGSIYYHFPSKEALLLAVHEEGVRQTMTAVQEALDTRVVSAWERLEAVCEAHLSTLLGGTHYSRVVSPDFARTLPAALRRTLIGQRDEYEALFAKIVDAVPVPRGVQRRYLRLSLLGSLNWALVWYRPGGDSPAVIARRIVDLYRRPLDPES